MKSFLDNENKKRANKNYSENSSDSGDSENSNDDSNYDTRSDQSSDQSSHQSSYLERSPIRSIYRTKMTTYRPKNEDNDTENSNNIVAIKEIFKKSSKLLLRISQHISYDDFEEKVLRALLNTER